MNKQEKEVENIGGFVGGRSLNATRKRYMHKLSISGEKALTKHATHHFYK